MTIEAILTRFAVAAERQAAALEGILGANVLGAQVVLEAAEAEAEEKSPTYAEQRKAEVKALKEAKLEDKPAKPRGRPPGSTKKAEVKVETPPAPEPEVEAEEEDPFAAEPEVVEPEEEITKEVLRSTMVALRDKVGKEKAYALLRDEGGGASCLPGSTAGKANTPGELKPELYAKVVKAARKLLA
jgi:outer membrane biosynthesis protein TonB